MKFILSSFQQDPDYLFKISHKVDDFISREISKQLSELNLDDHLIFSISCHSKNPDQLIFTDQLRGRKEPREITQFLSFPYKHRVLNEDWIFDEKKFDFKRTDNAYHSYSLNKYVQFIVESLRRFFEIEEVNVSIDFGSLEHDLIAHLEQNPVTFSYTNEELMHLKELIDGSHFSFHEPDGRKWQESEIGKKWINLKRKYAFSKDGELVEKDS